MQQHEEEGSNRAQQQQPRNARAWSAGKKRPWYGRALDCLHLWTQPAVVPAPPPAVAEEEGSPRWRSCCFAKGAALAFGRLLRRCAPACSHEAAVLLLGVHVDAAVPAPSRMRRSGSYSAGIVSHAAAVPVRAPTRPWAAPACVETAMRRRAPCMERSLADGAPMRRLVLGELAARRREEMEAVHVERRRSRGKWQPPGDSRLRRMSLPDGRYLKTCKGEQSGIA